MAAVVAQKRGERTLVAQLDGSVSELENISPRTADRAKAGKSPETMERLRFLRPSRRISKE